VILTEVIEIRINFKLSKKIQRFKFAPGVLSNERYTWFFEIESGKIDCLEDKAFQI